MLFFKYKAIISNPPIFADVVVETSSGLRVFDVEEPGWGESAADSLASGSRVGLIMRGRENPSAWLRPADGIGVHYFSRVIGKLSSGNHRQVRVACLESGDIKVWLHRDGTVEVAAEPTME